MDCKSPAAVNLLAVLACSGVLACSSVRAEVRSFQIPEGQAKDTLEVFGRQGRLSLFSDPRVVNQQHTNAVSGNLEPIQALKKMLKGSGLKYIAIDRNTLVVKVRPPLSEVLRAVVGRRPSDRRRAADTQTVRSKDSDDFLVEVLGNRSGNEIAVPPGITPRRLSDFADNGFVTAPDLLLRGAVENTGGGPSEESRLSNLEEKSNTGYGVGANLHGLSSADTLVLVNGRRLAPAGSSSTFTDISSIPLTAVDHVDILANGSTPLYGADAIGGIVNFVLRGADLREPPSQTVRVGTFASESVGELQLSQSFAWHPSSGGGTLALEYYKHDALIADDRKQASSNYTMYGGPNLDTMAGSPGTIIDPASGELWGIPGGQSGVGLKTSQLLAGKPNYYNLNQDATIIPKQSRFNIVADWQQLVTDDTSVFFDTIMSRRWVHAQSPAETTMLIVPAANPYYVNPGSGDSVDVMYGFGHDVGPLRDSGRVDNVQATIGVDFHLGRGWNLRAYAGHALERQQMEIAGLVNFGAVTSDLVPTNPGDPAFNPFGAGSSSAASVEKDIALPPQHWRYDSAFSYINASATGKLFELPAGTIAATVGAEYRRQRFSGEVDSGVSLSPDSGVLERNMSAMFAEVAIPVIRGDSTPKRVGGLDVSGGLRAETFDGAGPVWAPGMGFKYVATSSLTLTGNWARWYRPPSLPDLSEVNNFAVIAPVPDPSAAAGVSSVLVATGGNARLRPEQAESRNFGIQFAPADWPEFWASIKYFDVRVRERTYTITDLPETVLSDPQYAWLVKRDGQALLRQDICTHGVFFGVTQDCLNAPISAIVDMRLQNVASLRSAGIDGESRFKIESPSRWAVNFNLTSTYFLKYEQAYSPSAAPVELVSTAHNPIRFRFRGSVAWTDNAHWISTAINYQGRYRDTDAMPQRPVNAWTTLDLVVGVVLGDPGRGPDPQTRLSLSASNLFNSYPPVLFSNFGVAYDADNGSLVGRRVNLTLQRRW